MLSYIDIEYATYHVDRNMYVAERWSTLSDSQKNRYLNHSALLVDEAYIYAGRKIDVAQIMEFPRFFEEGYILNGDIPLDIKVAQQLILSYILTLEDYEEVIKVAKLGVKDLSDKIGLKADQGFRQIPVEAAMLLFPYSRMGWALRAKYPLDYGKYEAL